MIDTKVATSTEVYSKAARLAKMAHFVRMMFISRLKEKEETVMFGKICICRTWQVIYSFYKINGPQRMQKR